MSPCATATANAWLANSSRVCPRAGAETAGGESVVLLLLQLSAGRGWCTKPGLVHRELSRRGRTSMNSAAVVGPQ